MESKRIGQSAVKVMASLEENKSSITNDKAYLLALQDLISFNPNAKGIDSTWGTFDCLYFFTAYFFRLIDLPTEYVTPKKRREVREKVLKFLEDSSMRNLPYFKKIPKKYEDFTLHEFASYLIPMNLLSVCDCIKLIEVAKRNTLNLSPDFESLKENDFFLKDSTPIIELSRWLLDPIRNYSYPKNDIELLLKNSVIEKSDLSFKFLELWERMLDKKSIQESVQKIEFWVERSKWFSTNCPEGKKLSKDNLLVCHYVFKKLGITFDQYKKISDSSIEYNSFEKKIKRLNDALSESLGGHEFLVRQGNDYILPSFISPQKQLQRIAIEKIFENVNHKIFEAFKKIGEFLL